jgi:hypothetical protein
MKNEMNEIPLSKLREISVYFDNDLYEVAQLILKLKDARAKYESSNRKSRPTVNGLVRAFIGLIGPIYPDEETVISVIKKHKLPLNASIEFDEDIEC